MMSFGWHVMIFLVAVIFIGVAFKYGQKVGRDRRDEEWRMAINAQGTQPPL